VGEVLAAGDGWDTQALLQKLVDMRFGMFNHFNLGTFTDEEWAAPNQDPGIFAPPSVDTDQWADAALAAGMSYGVLTTKHHDGFALWPTKYGSQNVINSGYRRDVVHRERGIGRLHQRFRPPGRRPHRKARSAVIRHRARPRL
jgi:alpha-L-fucosidase